MTPTDAPRAVRGVAPVVAVLLLLAMTVSLAGAVAVAFGGVAPTEPASSAAFDLDVDESGDVRIEHLAGGSIDVRELTVRVTVEGEDLDHQPPVPFFSADGFVSGPEGPINPSSDPEWSSGERARFRVAATNEPTVDPGDRVVVTLVVDGATVGRLETTAATASGPTASVASESTASVALGSNASVAPRSTVSAEGRSVSERIDRPGSDRRPDTGPSPTGFGPHSGARPTVTIATSGS